jgi:hypothetical protein
VRSGASERTVETVTRRHKSKASVELRASSMSLPFIADGQNLPTSLSRFKPETQDIVHPKQIFTPTVDFGGATSFGRNGL